MNRISFEFFYAKTSDSVMGLASGLQEIDWNEITTTILSIDVELVVIMQGHVLCFI